MKRKCNNWLKTFLEWTIHRASAEDHLVLWTGIFTIAATAERKVKIGKDILGSWECYPYLYTMFVGDPGTFKTTTISYAEELLFRVPGLTEGSHINTQANLQKELVESPGHSLYLTVGEFSDLVRKSGVEMYEWLTSTFDGKRYIKSGTIVRGEEFVEKPCLNMLTATTPIWVATNLTQEQLGGGFNARLITLFTAKPKDRKLFFREVVDEDRLKMIEDALVHDLCIINELEGNFKFESKKLEDELEAWFVAIDSAKYHSSIRSFVDRKHVHVLKLAMILSLAEKDELVITKENADGARELIAFVEKELPRVFSSIGKNPYKGDTMEILKTVYEQGPISIEDLNVHFMGAGISRIIGDLVQSLVDADLIKMKSMKFVITDRGKELVEKGRLG